MAALDRVKEEIAYLKVWQGIAVISPISLGGWLVSAGDSAPLVDGDRVSLDRETISAVVAFLVLLVMVYIMWDAGRDKDKK